MGGRPKRTRPRDESGHIPHLTGLPEAKAARQDSALSAEHQDSLFTAGAGSFCQFHGAENSAMLGGPCFARQQKEGRQMRLWRWASFSQGESEVSTPAEERGSPTGKLTEALSPCTSPPQVINSQPRLGKTSDLLSQVQRRDVGTREGK